MPNQIRESPLGSGMFGPSAAKNPATRCCTSGVIARPGQVRQLNRAAADAEKENQEWMRVRRKVGSLGAGQVVAVLPRAVLKASGEAAVGRVGQVQSPRANRASTGRAARPARGDSLRYGAKDMGSTVIPSHSSASNSSWIAIAPGTAGILTGWSRRNPRDSCFPGLAQASSANPASAWPVRDTPGSRAPY